MRTLGAPLLLLLWLGPALALGQQPVPVSGWREAPAPTGWKAQTVQFTAPEGDPALSISGLVDPYELTLNGAVVRPLGPNVGSHGGWKRDQLTVKPGTENVLTIRFRDDLLPSFVESGRTLIGERNALWTATVRQHFPRAGYGLASCVLGLVSLMIFARRREQRIYLSFSAFACAHGLNLFAGGSFASLLWDQPALWDHLRLAARTFSPLALVTFFLQAGPPAPRAYYRGAAAAAAVGAGLILQDQLLGGKAHALLWLWANAVFLLAMIAVGAVLFRAVRARPREFWPSVAAVLLLMSSTLLDALHLGPHWLTANLSGFSYLALLLVMGNLTLRRFIAVFDALQEEVRARDEFLGVVSHELRNPLAAISAGVDVLTRQHAVPETTRHLDMLRRQATLLARLMDDLLDLGRIRAGRLKVEPRPLLLSSSLESAVEGMRHAATAKRLELTLHLPPEPLAVEADPVRLEQMITNLVRNAIQHTAAGGKVAVRTQAGESRVWISVQDSGRGLSREALALLFKDSAGAPTPPPAHSEGMGVGLAVVRKLARMQGGSVSAHSPGLEQGSTFTLELQRAPLPPAPAEPQVPPPAAASHALRVLLIDDNANLRLSMRLLLEHSGYRVQEAADGRVGLERLQGGDFDAAVVDLRMPELDGMELARRIRATPHGARLRLVALTGMAGAEEREAALQAGFDQVMIKPAHPDQLAAALR